MAYKITDACLKCGSCAEQCPVEAISGGKQGGNLPDVRAYTFHAVLQTIPADVLKGRPVGLLCQFNAGNAALFFPGAEQQPKGTAAGTEVQNPGVPGQFRKPAQEHAVRAQREAAFRYI